MVLFELAELLAEGVKVVASLFAEPRPSLSHLFYDRVFEHCSVSYDAQSSTGRLFDTTH